jgi:Spy/CpxP family protein refolding chaperone
MKNVSQVVIAGLVLGLLLPFAGSTLYAKGWHHKVTVEKQVKKITKKFNLTAEQQDQAKKLLEDKNQKMEDISKNYREQFRGILNDEQKKEWDEKEAKEMKCKK